MTRQTAAVLLTAIAVVALSTVTRPSAHADAPATTADDLAVADALGFATPVGTRLRIPNQLDGGSLLSKAAFSLDKAQGIAAAYTPGELGEAFLQTTVVAPAAVPPAVGSHVAYKNPALITAQTPSSPVFPASDGVAGGGVDRPPVEGATLRATTTSTSSEATAVGGFAVSQGGLTIGSGGSRSASRLLPDGTVVSEAHAFLSDVRLAGLLRIGGIDTTAKVTVRPGAAPVRELHVDIQAAQLGGIPVQIDQNGVHVASSALLGTAEVAEVNAALGALAGRGFSVTVLPGIVSEADATSAHVAGAALSIRGNVAAYVPTSVDTPAGPIGSPLGGVGTDDEVLLGQVEARSLAAVRGPLPAFDDPAAELPRSLRDLSSAVAPDEPLASGTPLPTIAVVGSPPSGPLDLDSPPAARPSGGAGGDDLALVRSTDAPGVDALRIGYRWVLLCTLAGVVAFLLRRRTRLV